MACSQFVPSLKIGYLYTYWAPLVSTSNRTKMGIEHKNFISIITLVVPFFLVDQGFVLAVTMVREAVDEVRRCRRDKEMNSQLYSKLTVRGDHNMTHPDDIMPFTQSILFELH